MAEDQGAEGIKELSAWLEKDDAKGRAMRARRLRDLVDILPIPSEGLSFLGGEESLICFDEVRRCYLDGSHMAVVLLCLVYVERELAASLYAAGWERAKDARLGAVLEKAHEDGVLSDFEWHTYKNLASLRVRLETLCLITVPCEPPCEESDVGDKNPCLCGASVFPVNPKSEAEAGLPVFHPAAFTDFSTGMTIIRRSLREQTAPTRGPRAQAHWRG